MPRRFPVAPIAAALADPTRAAMLATLMDGRALTATELAIEGGVSASTASSHLARLTEAGVLDVVRQGRHRYFRIRNADVAHVLETLQCFDATTARPPPQTGPTDPALRHARVCYDHLAGRCGTALLQRLQADGLLADRHGTLVLTKAGEVWCRGLGLNLDLDRMHSSRRPLCRACLDWSERRMHLAGALGAALLQRMLAMDHVRRQPLGRALAVTEKGKRFIEGA